jgi:hypothetical protein
LTAASGIKPTSGSRLLLSLLLGLGGCVATGFIIIVATNWSRISVAVREAADVLADIQRVRVAVANKYKSADVYVGARKADNEPSAILTIRIVNASELDALSENAARQEARDVAMLGLRILKNRDAYGQVDVALGGEQRFGIATRTTARRFAFRVRGVPTLGGP